MRRSIACALVLAWAGCSGSAATSSPFVFTEIALDGSPSELTYLRFIPGSDEFLALSRTGEVHHYRLDSDAGETTRLGGFTAPEVHTELDCGLLSLTFDPDYPNNHALYLGQCASGTESLLQRVTFDAANPDYAGTPETAVDVMRVGDERARLPWHNIGAMQFDEDGNLLVLYGDKTFPSNSQNVSNDLGALVRIRPRLGDGESGFDVVASNPFTPDPSASENVYAYGLRSPWQGFLDSRGRFWIGDVGSAVAEEINVVTAAGQNFGWGDHEGPCVEGCEGITDPIVYWDRSGSHPYVAEDPAGGATGLRVAWAALEYVSPSVDRYDGALDGKVLYGDMCAGFVRALMLDADNTVSSDEHIGHLPNATGWDLGPDGYVYATTLGDRCSTDRGADYGVSRLLRLERR